MKKFHITKYIYFFIACLAISISHAYADIKLSESQVDKVVCKSKSCYVESKGSFVLSIKVDSTTFEEYGVYLANITADSKLGIQIENYSFEKKLSEAGKHKLAANKIQATWTEGQDICKEFSCNSKKYFKYNTVNVDGKLIGTTTIKINGSYLLTETESGSKTYGVNIFSQICNEDMNGKTFKKDAVINIDGHPFRTVVTGVCKVKTKLVNKFGKSFKLVTENTTAKASTTATALMPSAIGGDEVATNPETSGSPAGSYKGNYSGDDSGVVSITIDDSGAILGSGNSTTDADYQFNISGQVSNTGNVSMTSSGSAGTAKFTGTISSQGIISGNWSDGVSDGSFSLSKSSSDSSDSDPLNPEQPDKLIIKDIFTSNSANHVFTLMNDGSLWAWGLNSTGQLGPQSPHKEFGLKSENIEVNPVRVTFLDSFTDFTISTGFAHSYLFRSSGNIYQTHFQAWGSNNGSLLGFQDNNIFNNPVDVRIGYGNRIRSLASSNELACMVDDLGDLWHWGAVVRGNNNLKPEKIGTNFDMVAVGWFHAIALAKDGTVWTWGIGNQYGQLGRELKTSNSSPIGSDDRKPTQILSNVSKIWAGSWSGYALKNDGSFWAWGDNTHGQLGDGTTMTRLTPMMISSNHSFASLAVGSQHVMALTDDGTLWGWGDNSSGQLADGTTTNSLIPKQIGTGYSKIAASAGATFAVNKFGELFAAGNNQWGQLGNGSADLALIPNSELKKNNLTTTSSNGGQSNNNLSACFKELIATWNSTNAQEPVRWTFDSNYHATMVQDSLNYGPAAQRIYEMVISSCANNKFTYKYVRAAIVNTVDPSWAYDKTLANSPNDSYWTKVYNQEYSVSGGILKFGYFDYKQ